MARNLSAPSLPEVHQDNTSDIICVSVIAYLCSICGCQCASDYPLPEEPNQKDLGTNPINSQVCPEVATVPIYTHT